jgi:2-amino-4-hydroxy-6-hydroxymethyldihydropteridine diphosphokinase
VPVCFVAFGGNLGDPPITFRAAANTIEQDGHRILNCAPLYKSKALRGPEVHYEVPDYWNTVVKLDTTYDAPRLVAYLLAVEQRHGRVRSSKWASRCLDLDLLVMGSQTLDLPQVTLPHPELKKRIFVLQPLVDIEPDLMLPCATKALDCLNMRIKSGDRIEKDCDDWRMPINAGSL